VDVVEWSRALDVRLSEWCCSVKMSVLLSAGFEPTPLIHCITGDSSAKFVLKGSLVYIYIYIRLKIKPNGVGSNPFEGRTKI
jgi:hypothetical protein